MIAVGSQNFARTFVKRSIGRRLVTRTAPIYGRDISSSASGSVVSKRHCLENSKQSMWRHYAQ
jgi:hypothetical protein